MSPRHEDHVLCLVERDSREFVVKLHTFTYNPDPEYVIVEGTTLIVLGETDSIVKLRPLVAG